MKKITTGLVLAIVGSFALCGVTIAADDTIGTLAGITMNLQHFPSDADKEVLNGIIESDDSSDGEVTIAMAILNMQHTVTADDAQRLDDLVADDMADEDIRTLAGILLHIKHMPSDEDKAKLAQLAGK